MDFAVPCPYYHNPAGWLLECPAGGHLRVRFARGPRCLADLQTLLGVAKQLLARRGWDKLLADQRRMSPFTPDECHWLTQYWLRFPGQNRPALYGALLLPADDFARLPRNQVLHEERVAALAVRRFGDEAPAEAWLRTCHQRF